LRTSVYEKERHEAEGRLGLSVILILCLVLMGASEITSSRYTHHQVYRATKDQAVRAIETVFTKVGGGLLGADWENGVVVSKGVRGRPSDVTSVTQVNPNSEVIYFFVALVAPRGEERIEVQILTVLSARAMPRGTSEGGFYTSGNELTEGVYKQLAESLGPGELVLIGD